MYMVIRMMSGEKTTAFGRRTASHTPMTATMATHIFIFFAPYLTKTLTEMANIAMYISLAAPPDIISHTDNWQGKSDGLSSGHEHPEMITLVMAPNTVPTLTSCPAVTILIRTTRRVPTIDFSKAIAGISRMLKSSSGVRRTMIIKLKYVKDPCGPNVVLVVLVKFIADFLFSNVKLANS